MMFETGKTYRTRDGSIATIGPMRPESKTYPIGGSVAHKGLHCWTGDGRWNGSYRTKCDLDLLPGAIEDENRTATDASGSNKVDPICVLQKQIDGIQRDIDGIDNSQAIFLKKQANHGERLMNLQDRIHALEDVAEIGGKAMQTQIDGQAALLLEVVAELDWLRSKAETAEAIDTIKRETAQPTKRTIKGGWFNIYRGDYGRPNCHGPLSREMADCMDQTEPRVRVACIHIPDITEGEGL